MSEPTYNMYMLLGEAYRAFAFSASKCQDGKNTHYEILLDLSSGPTGADDVPVTSEPRAFCGHGRPLAGLIGIDLRITVPGYGVCAGRI